MSSAVAAAPSPPGASQPQSASPSSSPKPKTEVERDNGESKSAATTAAKASSSSSSSSTVKVPYEAHSYVGPYRLEKTLGKGQTGRKPNQSFVDFLLRSSNLYSEGGKCSLRADLSFIPLFLIPPSASFTSNKARQMDSGGRRGEGSGKSGELWLLNSPLSNHVHSWHEKPALLLRAKRFPPFCGS